jgi:hypothetical protein
MNKGRIMERLSLPMPEPIPGKRGQGCRRLVLALAGVSLVGLCWLLLRQEMPLRPDDAGQPDRTGSVRPVQDEGNLALDPPGDSNLDDSALHLALKSISLSQGEGGFELWRLKAEWATVQKQGETIVVEKPYLTYFVKDGAPPMLVQSATGSIDQKNRILRFLHSVRVSQEAKLLTSDMLIYQGDEKTMTFPGGGELTDAGVFGRAGRLVWHIEEKRIDASDGVSVHFADSRKKQADTPGPLQKAADVAQEEFPLPSDNHTPEPYRD